MKVIPITKSFMPKPKSAIKERAFIKKKAPNTSRKRFARTSDSKPFDNVSGAPCPSVLLGAGLRRLAGPFAVSSSSSGISSEGSWGLAESRENVAATTSRASSANCLFLSVLEVAGPFAVSFSPAAGFRGSGTDSPECSASDDV